MKANSFQFRGEDETRYSDMIVAVRNTFVDISAPSPPDLLRASTVPVRTCVNIENDAFENAQPAVASADQALDSVFDTGDWFETHAQGEPSESAPPAIDDSFFDTADWLETRGHGVAAPDLHYSPVLGPSGWPETAETGQYGVQPFAAPVICMVPVSGWTADPVYTGVGFTEDQVPKPPSYQAPSHFAFFGNDRPAPETEAAPTVFTVARESDGLPTACSRDSSNLTQARSTGGHQINWVIEARKLESQDQQAVSPMFHIDMPDGSDQVYILTIHSRPTKEGRRGRGFKKSKGWGKVELKCLTELPEDVPNYVSFKFWVGCGAKLQQPRGPVTHNFADQSCRGLPRDDCWWDFSSAIEDDLKVFTVCAEIVPLAPGSPTRASAL